MIITPWDRRRTTFAAALCSLLLLLTSCVSNSPAGATDAAALPQDELSFKAAEAAVTGSEAGQPFGFFIRHNAIRQAGLAGLSMARVEELLGRPSLRRRDWPADLLQYEADGCVMDIVFYDDAPQDGVVHSEARLAEGSGLPGDEILANECLAKIQARS